MPLYLCGMMNDKKYRYSLCNARPVRLFICPRCGKRDFKKYVDNTTGHYVAHNLGRCNRQQKCGYHARPEYAGVNYRTNNDSRPYTVQKTKEKPLPITYIDKHLMQRSMGQPCHFKQWLRSFAGDDAVDTVLGMYPVGSSKHWPGATVFWQVDVQGNVRTGKVMLYHALSGKRVREPFNHITWVHSLLPGQKTFNMQQCLFGEHLLTVEAHAKKPVAIVESEKTAIIAALYKPDMLWLACGGMQQLNYNLLLPLRGRRVVFFADKGAVHLWQEKADEWAGQMKGVMAEVSTFLEDTGLPEGSDMADYLLSNLPEKPKPVQTPLDKLMAKNPAISKLVGTLGLELEEE